MVPDDPLDALDDDAFLTAFEHHALPSRLTHRGHLRLAWLYVRRGGADAAATHLTTALARLAAAAGAADRYHETMTRAWLEIVAHVAASAPESGFDEALEAHPWLADRVSLQRHYSAAQLESGRGRWVEPDLLPLPSA